MNTLTLELSSFVENRNTHPTLSRLLNYRTTEQFGLLGTELAIELDADPEQVGELAAACAMLNAFEGICSVVHVDTFRERVEIDQAMPKEMKAHVLDIVSKHGRTDLPKLTKKAIDLLKNLKPKPGQELNLVALYCHELSLDTLNSVIEGMSDDELKVLDAMTKGRVSKYKYFYSELEVFES